MRIRAGTNADMSNAAIGKKGPPERSEFVAAGLALAGAPTATRPAAGDHLRAGCQAVDISDGSRGHCIDHGVPKVCRVRDCQDRHLLELSAVALCESAQRRGIVGHNTIVYDQQVVAPMRLPL